MIFFSSIFIPGIDVAVEPVAITIFLVLKFSFLLSLYTTTSFLEKITPLPFI